MTPLEAWNTLKQKSPVNYPAVQQTVNKCFTTIKPFLTEKQHQQLRLAQEHSFNGEGRSEWDNTCKDIEQHWKLTNLSLEQTFPASYYKRNKVTLE